MRQQTREISRYRTQRSGDEPTTSAQQELAEPPDQQRTADPQNVANLQSTAISILMAVYALLLIGAGVASRTVINRVLGLGLIGLVVVKLYIYDVWLLVRIYRIVAFAALGALLLITSYLYSRYREKIEVLWRE